MMFAKKAKWKVKAALYQRWLEHQLANLGDGAKDTWDDFDANDILRPLGLAKARSSTASSAGAFLVGAAVGGVLALMLAPKTGTELRSSVKSSATGFFNKNAEGGTQPAANA